MLDKIFTFLLSDWDKFMTQVESINEDSIILIIMILIVVKFVYSMVVNSYYASGSKSHERILR